MSAFIERITGSQVGGATERSIRLGSSTIIGEEQLGSLLGVVE
jgi:hypothetical protein